MTMSSQDIYRCHQCGTLGDSLTAAWCSCTGDDRSLLCSHCGECICHAPGEVKRLFVQPRARKGGWGGRLVEKVLVEARAIGYRELKLDTLDWMADARALYTKHGFRECAPYYVNPLPGAVYMALAL